MKRSALVSLAFFLALGAASAEADLFRDIYRGLELAATPSGFPITSTADGTRVSGARSGRLRIVPRGLGPGYQLEFDRTFGVDSRGRPETFHLGGLGELTLDGGAQMTLGYSGKKFRTLSSNVVVNNLSYTLRSSLGVQDAVLTGTLNAIQMLEVNPLGFYDLTLNVSNADSELRLNGVLVRDAQDTNFDVGPIVVQGNIFFDLVLGMLNSYGVDVSGLEGITPQSPIDRINAAITEQLQQTQVAGEMLTLAGSPLTLETVLGTDALVGPNPVGGLGPDAGGGLADQSQRGAPTLIPEPGTLLLMALGGATMWYARRRR